MDFSGILCGFIYIQAARKKKKTELGILWALQPDVSFMTLHWHLSQINVDVVWEERRSSECLDNR